MPFKATFLASWTRRLALCLLALGIVPAASADEGIRFTCAPNSLGRIESGMAAYLADLKIDPGWVVKKADLTRGTLVYTLNTPEDDADTLHLKERPEYAIHEQIVRLPMRNGKTRKVSTVSQKEILLALLQHGRLTEFSGGNCTLEALKELVGVRQNIVAWSENLDWVWPDGGPAEWNAKYWRDGTPLPGVPLQVALDDAFHQPHKYSIGCYTAAKLIMVQGILDYFRRVEKRPSRRKLIEARLAFDRDPLLNVEPGKMWSFEKDFDPGELSRPGKLLQIQYSVAPRNFVPGDWAYLLNTDPVSARKTGYEGSSAIYLGRNKFNDDYNDNGHAYTYREKLNEVYQWRNGVFSRTRDGAKARLLSREDFERLSKPPAEGGLVMDFRVFPLFFAQDGLPELEQSSLPPD